MTAALVIARPLWKLGFHDGSCLHQPLNPPVHLTFINIISIQNSPQASAHLVHSKYQPHLPGLPDQHLFSQNNIIISLNTVCTDFPHTPLPIDCWGSFNRWIRGVFQFWGFCSDGLTFSCSASPQCSPSSAFTPGYWLPHRGYIQLSLATFMESHRFYAKTVLNYLTRESYPLQNGWISGDYPNGLSKAAFEPPTPPRDPSNPPVAPRCYIHLWRVILHLSRFVWPVLNPESPSLALSSFKVAHCKSFHLEIFFQNKVFPSVKPLTSTLIKPPLWKEGASLRMYLKTLIERES